MTWKYLFALGEVESKAKKKKKERLKLDISCSSEDSPGKQYCGDTYLLVHLFICTISRDTSVQRTASQASKGLRGPPL